ncbi:MAG: hypothetical protein JSV05_10080 [Candidatus Bathyarchaeota archaeon]|nr:MAG: hypothetical protein JSV05_10080 [Candidatus Bathyarchaeota archaeon]
MSAGVIALYYRVDEIVHVTLYNYGLQFDYEWATPYWTFLRLALFLLLGIALINGISMVTQIIELRGIPQRRKIVSRRQERERQIKVPESSPQPELKPKEIRRIDRSGEDDGVEVMALPIVCNKCGKVFTQPLCMFDFKSGKPRLVNVCPYCNAVLAVSGNSRSG